MLTYMFFHVKEMKENLMFFHDLHFFFFLFVESQCTLILSLFRVRYVCVLTLKITVVIIKISNMYSYFGGSNICQIAENGTILYT